jgi:hypothetical protein
VRINEKDKKQDANQQRRAVPGFRDAHGDTAGNENCTDEIQKEDPGGQSLRHGQETFHEFLYPELYDPESNDGESE